jgi:L-fuconate dehydratase
LLIDLSPEQIVNPLDLSYLEDELTKGQAVQFFHEQLIGKDERKIILEKGYPGNDTSVGWFNYDDEKVRANCRKAIAEGFTAMKLKVGSADPLRDIRRGNIVREESGTNCRVMLDANQQ